MTLVGCPVPRYSLPSIRLVPGGSQGCFSFTWDRANMSHFQPIPPCAQVVEFSSKKTSRGEVQTQKVMDRTFSSHRRKPSTSPRKRQRIENEAMSATIIPNEAFVYVDPSQGQGHVCVQFMVLVPVISMMCSQTSHDYLREWFS